MIWIKLEDENMTVTGYYLHTIGQAFERLNQQVTYTSNLGDIKPKAGDTVVVCTAPSVKAFMRKDIKVIYWAQGVWPEESLMRHSSRIRFYITSAIEKAALKRADFAFFVSDHMRAHFENKYGLSFGNNYYIMPCSNDTFHAESFECDRKYKDNVFCYAGATSVWQCFEETVSLYARIEEKRPDSKLLLLVKDKDLALEMVEKYGILNYEIDFVPVAQLPEKLKRVKFGFLLRKPSVVNAVATPTKTLTYLSNGVVPVYSECLNGIRELFNECGYKVEVQEGNELDSVLDAAKKPIDNAEIREAYSRIYHDYYDASAHVERISTLFKKTGLV